MIFISAPFEYVFVERLIYTPYTKQASKQIKLHIKKQRPVLKGTVLKTKDCDAVVNL